MELIEIGARLREERERRGLSLEDIAQQTKISLTSLQGMESGMSEMLPHPVYLRGFLKVYAKFLDIDLGESLNELRLDNEDAPYQPVYKAASSERVKHQPELGSLRAGRRVTLAILVLLLGLAGGTYWFFDRFGGHEQPAGQATAQEAPLPAARGEQGDQPAKDPGEPMPDEGAVEVSPEPDAVSEAPASVDPAPVESRPASEVATQPAAPVASTPAAVPNSAPEPRTQQAPSEPARPATENVAVIQARETCWVQATHADGTVREYLLQPGASVRISFATVSLMLGNAGGVDLVVNGQPYPLNAQSGQVRRLTLP